jgi:hypothetical protein
MLKQQTELPQLVFTVKETATILKCSTKSVYRLIDRDLLKASTALRHIRITKRSLESFLTTTSGEVK